MSKPAAPPKTNSLTASVKALFAPGSRPGSGEAGDHGSNAHSPHRLAPLPPEFVSVVPLPGPRILFPGTAMQVAINIARAPTAWKRLEPGAYVACVPVLGTAAPDSGAASKPGDVDPATAATATSAPDSDQEDAAANANGMALVHAGRPARLAEHGCLGRVVRVTRARFGGSDRGGLRDPGREASEPDSRGVHLIDRLDNDVDAHDGFVLLVEGLTRIKVHLVDAPDVAATDGQMQHKRHADAVAPLSMPMARVTLLYDSALTSSDRETLEGLRMLRAHAHALLRAQASALPARMLRDARTLVDRSSPALLTYILGGVVEMPWSERAALLGQDLPDRVRALGAALQRQVDAAQVQDQLRAKVADDLARKQREAILRHQLEILQRELAALQDEGVADGSPPGSPRGGRRDPAAALGMGGGDEVRELEKRLAEGEFPQQVQATVKRDLRRLKAMSPAHAEYHTLMNHIDWVLSTPWTTVTPVDNNIDLAVARRQLDADHHGLEPVKKRILEYLAVNKLRNSLKGPILCLHGPPGVGKTSLGKSVADSMGRKFARIALGGVRDESELRGHRRTYVGAMPGVLVQTLKRLGTRNPVILLDEVDKLGHDALRGDPAAALLEVLDPEQNDKFTDHYLGLPLDLSQVVFLATCNTTQSIPRPLLDRMEVISLPGYAPSDKLAIGQRLMQKQVALHGLPAGCVLVADLPMLVQEYTREPGVRQLERTLAALCRAVAVEYTEWLARKEVGPFQRTLREADFRRVLGAPKYSDDPLARACAQSGVAVGLAWTGMGAGAVQLVEAMAVPGGSGRVQLTGQLGSVLRESAQLAVTWLKAHAHQLGITAKPDDALWNKVDLHLHLPSGAVAKDGPSAGVALLAALVSLALNKPLRPRVGMTGEIGLRGQVMPVGGVAEKCLAAVRHGLDTVVLPARNKPNWEEEVPEDARARLHPTFCSTVAEVLCAVLPDPPGWLWEQRHLEEQQQLVPRVDVHVTMPKL